MGVRGRGTSTIAVLAVLLVFPASASAIDDPQQEIGGAGSQWFHGSVIQQPGQNCSVLGNPPYTEIMINGYGSYGGAQGGGFVQVGDEYWTSLLVGVPGNPCGSGSSTVITDLKMPKNTAYDSSRPIRCFGTNRFSDDFFEITNQTWSFLGQSGRYCPTGPNLAYSGIGQGWGYRPLANGQLFMIFIPVKSTSVINGAGECCEQGEFNWLTTASAADASPYRSYTWANVLAAGSPPGPFFWFSRNPSADPYWDTSAPAGEENRAEFWANLNSANQPGFLCFEIRRASDNVPAADCHDAEPPVGTWNGNVPNTGNPLFQVFADGADAGPNGGYTPFFYGDILWGTQFKITWIFDPNSGPNVSSAPQFFTLLSGPDLDDDGVADSADACPGVKGTAANGCFPVVKMDGSTAVKRGAKIKRRGQTIDIECNLAANVTADLKLKAGLASRLGLPRRIGGGRGTCKPAADNKLKLTLTKKAKRKLARPGKERATLSITFKQGSRTDKVTVPVKIA